MEKKACIFNIQKFSIHDGPGIRSVVFFKGCPLRCYWCANPESQLKNPEKMWDNHKKQLTTIGSYQTVAEIMTELLKDQPFYEESGGGVTLSGGEVLFQADFAIELLKALHEKQIHTACETTGYAKEAVFQQLLEHIDLLYFDVKHYDTNRHLAGIGVRNELILANLTYALHHHKQVIVRVPVIPGFNDTLDDAAHFAQLFQKLGVTTVELLPFHQFGEKKYTCLNRSYALKNVPQLHSSDLVAYQERISAQNIQCLVR